MTNPTICGSTLSKSSIHGLKYIGDTKVSKIGRFLWTMVLILSGIGCAYFSYQIYNEFRKSPDIGLKIQHVASRNVPFPAITICPQSKVSCSNWHTLKLPRTSLSSNHSLWYSNSHFFTHLDQKWIHKLQPNVICCFWTRRRRQGTKEVLWTSPSPVYSQSHPFNKQNE